MQWLTVTMSVIGLASVLTLRPLYGLIGFLAIHLFYPEYLRVSVGTIDISAGRLVITALLLKCLADPMLMRRFRWKLPDTCVALYLAISTVALMFTMPFEAVLENRSGIMMDTLFVYVAIRMIVVSRNDLVTIVKAIGVMLLPLAVLGVYESLTGFTPFAGLHRYCPWAPTALSSLERSGVSRAMGPLSQPIMFGMSFATLLPLVWLLRRETGVWHRWCYLLCAAAVMGLLSSVSGGPYLQLMVVLIGLVLERRSYLVKPVVACFILGCVLVEVASHRHFYYVLADLTFDGKNGWYRARLLDVAIEKLPEYWAVGYGLIKDPGWGPLIIGLPYTDIVNHYVLIAARYGVVSLAAFVTVMGVMLSGLRRMHHGTGDPWIRSCAWSVAVSLVGLLTVCWTVCIFNEMTTTLYIILGVAGCLYRARVRAGHRALNSERFEKGCVLVSSRAGWR